jgi:hypothetical protein
MLLRVFDQPSQPDLLLTACEREGMNARLLFDEGFVKRTRDAICTALNIGVENKKAAAAAL